MTSFRWTLPHMWAPCPELRAPLRSFVIDISFEELDYKTVIQANASEATTVRVERRGRVGIVTLNRPARRNALSSTLIEELPRLVTELGADGSVDAIVLTGADPAFCAGLDLNELGSTGDNLGLPDRPEYPWPWRVEVPVIGAINGPAVAGGFELALHCDVLLASDRALFADTHGRVGQFPGAGLTVRLVEAVGLQRARMLCLTGNFIDAATAARWGLVVDVFSHEELLERATGIAADIADNDRRFARRMLAHFEQLARLDRAAGMELVAEEMRTWNDDFTPDDVERRRQAVLARSLEQRSGR